MSRNSINMKIICMINIVLEEKPMIKKYSETLNIMQQIRRIQIYCRLCVSQKEMLTILFHFSVQSYIKMFI